MLIFPTCNSRISCQLLKFTSSASASTVIAARRVFRVAKALCERAALAFFLDCRSAIELEKRSERSEAGASHLVAVPSTSRARAGKCRCAGALVERIRRCGALLARLAGNDNDAAFLVHFNASDFRTRRNCAFDDGSNIPLSDAHAARPTTL
jgi:hypothetical protein